VLLIRRTATPNPFEACSRLRAGERIVGFEQSEPICPPLEIVLKRFQGLSPGNPPDFSGPKIFQTHKRSMSHFRNNPASFFQFF
jgi:hypothetical protein